MSAEDVAAATSAKVERAQPSGAPVGVRKGIVTATSPFTVLMNSTSVTNMPRLPSYSPVVGDVVLILMDGASPLVMDRVIAGGTSAGGDWVVDSTRNPILKTTGGNETRGNATVIARYRLTNGECQWQGHYVLGSTTSWPAGNIQLVLPFNPEASYFVSSGASMPGDRVRAYNGSFFNGFVEYLGGGNLGLVECRTGGGPASAASTNWSTSSPFTWGAGHILSWNFRYPIV